MTQRSTIRADVDGDGLPDVTTVYMLPSGRTEESHDEPGLAIDPDPKVRARVETGDGSVIDEELPWWVYQTDVEGATDLNGDGKAELWIDPHDGATAHHLGMVVFVDCGPRQVRADGPGPAAFLYSATGNASMGATVGIECVDLNDDGVVEIVTKDLEVDEGSERWSYVAYRLEADTVTVVAEEHGEALATAGGGQLVNWRQDGLSCRRVAEPH